MVKEFKEYDRKYRHLKGKVLPGESVLILGISHWPFMHELVKADHATIRQAVYFDGAASENWQMFRVSLKGWTTAQKLDRLAKRWKSADEVERIRLNNYIDSMKRSGLIDQEGKVIK